MTTRHLILAGSGEFTPALASIDRLLATFVSDPVVAIIPTAAGQESDAQKWIDQGIAHYKTLDIKAFGLPIFTKIDAENSEYVQKVRDASIIYFSGGDPGYLLTTLFGSSLWDQIYTMYMDGAVLAGSSAGAMVMGSSVLANAQDVFLKGAWPPIWKKAFGLVPYTIFPHFDFAKREMGAMVLKVTREATHAASNWLGIDEDTAMLITNETNGRVVGKGTVYRSTEHGEEVYREGPEGIVYIRMR